MGQMPPNGSAAPPFYASPPQDRVGMSFEQYCDGLLSVISRGPLTPEQAQYFAATVASAQEAIQAQLTGQAPGEEAPPEEQGAPGEEAPDEAQDFGEQPGTVPYGDA